MQVNWCFRRGTFLFHSSQVRFRNSVINATVQFGQWGYVTRLSDVKDEKGSLLHKMNIMC